MIFTAAGPHGCAGPAAFLWKVWATKLSRQAASHVSGVCVLVKVACCPTCNHPIPSDDLRGALTSIQYQLFHTIQRAGKAGITLEALAERLYSTQPNGGPEDAEGVVKTHISHIRPLLEARGMTIPRHGKRGFGGKHYRVVPFEVEQ